MIKQRMQFLNKTLMHVGYGINFCQLQNLCSTHVYNAVGTKIS